MKNMKKLINPYKVNKYFTINKTFLERNNAEKNLSKIVKLFKNKFRLFGIMKRTKNINKLLSLAEDVKQNEFKIQTLFNFSPSEDWFRFWQLPGCSCPRMDNEDRLGTPYKIRNLNCKLHSIWSNYKGENNEF